ncbi:TPA: hypothetical protein P0P67_002658 [Staphylococcus aureus]|nr:hypothetical protein [Staphylococcus aureus]
MLANQERKAIIETIAYLENNSELNALYDIPVIETVYSDEELIDYKINIDDNESDVVGTLQDTEYQTSDFYLYYFNN